MAVLQVLTLALATQLTLQLTSARNYEVVLERVEGYEHSKEYVSDESVMRIRRADKATLPGLTHSLVTLKPWPNDTEVEATIYELQSNKAIPSWLRYKRNFCDYIVNEKKPIINELGRLYQFGQCPISGTYRIDNWRPDDKLLPPMLPGPERMMLGFRFATGTTTLLKYGVVFFVDRSKGRRGGGAATPPPRG